MAPETKIPVDPRPPDPRAARRSRIALQFALIGGNIAGLCVAIILVAQDGAWNPTPLIYVAIGLALTSLAGYFLLPIIVASIAVRRVVFMGAIPLVTILIWFLGAEGIALHFYPERDNIWDHSASLSHGTPNLGQMLLIVGVSWLVLCGPVWVIRWVASKVRGNRQKRAAKVLAADAARVVEGEWPPRPGSGTGLM